MSDVLDCFLSIANNIEAADQNIKRQNHLQEIDVFNVVHQNEDHCSTEKQNHKGSKKADLIQPGANDASSYDEDNKYHGRFNESGSEIKHLLQSETHPQDFIKKSDITWKTKVTSKLPVSENSQQSVFCDPIFGLRIVNPVVSFDMLKERMIGREAVAFSHVKKFVAGNISDKNWVIAGVIVNKSSVKTSSKGKQFLIWTLSDLQNDIKTIAMFLFGNAYKHLWKTTTGTVVGVLNPAVFEQKSGTHDQATLSIDNSQKVMILGQSKDLGKCKSIKKNGEQCTSIVNINKCEFCVYHIKQEYEKWSKRSVLQSNFSGKGLTALRNKVLGKNEVFYAGKSYTAIPAKKSKKLQLRDESLQKALAGKSEFLNAQKKGRTQMKKSATNVELTQKQKFRDLKLLEHLRANLKQASFDASHSADVTLELSRKTVTDVMTKLKDNEKETTSVTDLKIQHPRSYDDILSKTPLLNAPKKGIIDFNAVTTGKQKDRAKLNALRYVQTNGSLHKSDPNSPKQNVASKKRLLNNLEENICKKSKLENEFTSDRFKKIMQATSMHGDLLDKLDNDETEKYFEKLEMKEKLEDKMTNTYKVACKAVKCFICKYESFSASQFCKDNKHPLKVYDATKRFFKCGDCGNRTATLHIVPKFACKNCGSGKWERTGMLKEKTVQVKPKLSIRGGEQTFINSHVTDANLDLLVSPD